MKKILLLASAFVLTLGAIAQTNPDEVIKMNTETHNFGKIKQGVPVTFEFEIKNISNKPVVVESATAGCGCTTPKKPEGPIMPGESAKLAVQYNAAAGGQFTKPVTIKLAGIDQAKTVNITGEVVADQQVQQPAAEVAVPVKTTATAPAVTKQAAKPTLSATKQKK